MGLDHVRGDLVVLMDADGQDDPAELAKLLAELDTGVRPGHRAAGGAPRPLREAHHVEASTTGPRRR
jgi:glycosyltransferase involved in cell wall biosynthesis